jgi:hypothetical protein
MWFLGGVGHRYLCEWETELRKTFALELTSADEDPVNPRIQRSVLTPLRSSDGGR